MPKGKRNGDAQTIYGDGAEPTAGEAKPPVGNRADTIREVYAKLKRLYDERAELSEDITKYKSEVIKGQLGLKISDFMIGYRLYNLEDKDRDELLDTIHETFDALGRGEQLDWIKAAAGRTAKPAAAVHDPGPAAA